VSAPDLQQVKEALLNAGVEVYRTRQDAIHVAERVRLHIMDSGVLIRAGDALTVEFTARSQRSDFPHAPADQLFARVRETVGNAARARGYAEGGSRTIEVRDPVDDSRVLDVWHEVTFGKPVHGVDEAVAEVSWALEVEKYVTA
jgi:hypothetical protein